MPFPTHAADCLTLQLLSGVRIVFAIFSLAFCIAVTGIAESVVAPESVQLAPPRTLVDGVLLTQIAKEPTVATPVGVAFDRLGRLLVVESHTHFRPEGYEGPEWDRVRIVEPTKSGEPAAWGVFAEGFRHAMGIATHPDGSVYLVCRNEIFRLWDRDGDGVADEKKRIAFLETEADYPHNGLGGIAIADEGKTLYLGLGENFGFPYKIVGSDGKKETEITGVGMIFKCQPDGSQIKRHARGFWNPFGVAVAGNRLLTVDNDPDASPPCRLIDVAPHGDYGFAWMYGRAGVHPLQAWNGQLPGTRGMIAGTGEAPCAVLYHRGYVWVTSWGEHRIERYHVGEKEGQLTTNFEVVVQGESDFRPTGMVVGPEGDLWFGDWVSRSYPVHGTGRVWRLSFTEPADDALIAKSNEIFASPTPADPDDSPAVTELAEQRWQRSSKRDTLIQQALASSESAVRLYAVRWIADEHLTEYRGAIRKLLEGPIPSDRYYLALLAAIDWLDRPPEARHSGIADGLLARELRNKSRDPETWAIALRLINPNHGQLTLEVLEDYLNSDCLPLKRESVRTLASQNNSAARKRLLEFASNKGEPAELRADALVGLASDVQQHLPLLKSIASETSSAAQREAIRLMRMQGSIDPPKEKKPKAESLEEWLMLLEGPADPEAGRRLFSNASLGRCILCHQHRGRGGEIGPELTHVGAKLSRRRLVESILQPSREVAPQYVPWVLETDAGEVKTGLFLHRGGDSGIERYVDGNAKPFELPSEEIVFRKPAEASLMPSGLQDAITLQDFRDLLAFLEQGSDE